MKSGDSIQTKINEIEDLKVSEQANSQCFNLNNYRLQDLIGQGSFGKVYKAIDLRTGEICAAKISILSVNNNSNEIMTNLSREVNILSKLNHPSVLKFKGYSPVNFKNKPKPVIITELASNGSLGDLIIFERNSKPILNDTRKLIIIYGIASAMSYLH